MSQRRGCLGVAVGIVLVLALGAWFLGNGYGPLAHYDEPTMSPGQARARIDQLVSRTMAGISPAPTYCNFSYASERDSAHWDGEPSRLSDLMGSLDICTRISPARVPVLLDQITKAWQGLSSVPVTQGAPNRSGYPPTVATLNAQVPGVYMSVQVLAPVASGATQSETVEFLFHAYGVRYQPTHDYKLPGPAPTSSPPAPADDPYWSH
ncbi:hypothetical protein [Kitasatospora sp. LaBMicrA B282]|uniref:hypothetical protein n=1 Tax=Kitasatospora sp. LaBMicrA B282 TaxID=3420949 RepID=UPI003D0BF8F2